MFPNIDYVKMLEQEPEFKKYCQSIALDMILLEGKGMEGFMTTLFSFYNIGMTLEQVHEWLVQMKRFGDGGSRPAP